MSFRGVLRTLVPYIQNNKRKRRRIGVFYKAESQREVLGDSDNGFGSIFYAYAYKQPAR